MRLLSLALASVFLLVACEPTSSTNLPPTASGRSLTTAEDTSLSFTLEAADPEAKPLLFTNTAPAHGTLTSTGSTFTYAPEANYFGADGASVTVSDGVASMTVTINITVTPVNDAPVAVDDAVTSGTALSAASLLANDTDVDGDALSLTAVGSASVGTVVLAGDLVTFTAPPGFSGPATFEYTLSDGTASDTGLVTVTVTFVNQAPVAVDDAATTDEDTAAVITAATLLANDTDVDGPALSVTQVSNATGGTVALSGTSLTFTPAADTNGAAGFDYTVSDGTLTDTGHVVVTVTAVNDAPVALDDSASATEDLAVLITAATLLANDTDVDGPTLTLTAVSNATGGTVALAGSSVTFSPAANSSGTAGFDYTVSDGTLTDTGHVVVTVAAVNDAPVALDDTTTTPEDTALVLSAATLLANDTDVDGPTPTLTAVSNAAGGTVVLADTSITFTPTANLTGAAGFDYTLSDGTLTDTGHVVVNLAAVNDAPVASDDAASTDEDTAVVLTAAALISNDTDLDGATLTLTAVSNATGGAVALAGTSITFTPGTDFSGAAGFDYTVSDGTLTDTGHVDVTVRPVNDAPVAVDDTATTDEDTTLVLSAATLLSNDTDVDGPTLTVSAVSNASNGTVVLAGTSITFTPSANFNGAAGFDYTVSDGARTDPGHVDVTVTAVNDAPIADAQSVSTAADTAVVITLTATDLDSATVTFAVAGGPSHGSLGALTSTGSLSATVTYTPATAYAGADSFTITANDGALTSTAATVALTVTTTCGDGAVGPAEPCDDHGTSDGDGCSASCLVETGWSCAGSPSACAPICGDTLVVGTEPCDDGDTDENDGCTSRCVLGKVCDSVALAGGDQFTTDPMTGTCYAAFLTESTTWGAAQASCSALNGHLVTITSAGEQALVHSIHAGVPWIGATEDGNDTDAVFDWFTPEPWAFNNFAPGEPNDDVGFGGNGECLAMVASNGGWGDTDCNFTGFVDGRICELPVAPCGDGLIEGAEICDDGNRTAGDGCSATCTVESGATCTGFSPTVCSKLVINEVDYDQPGDDNAAGVYEFVEILNVGTGPAALSDVALVLLSGAGTPSTEYYFDGSIGLTNVSKRILLTAAGVPGNSLPSGGMIVVSVAAQFALAGFPSAAFRIPVVAPTVGWIQNGGPDAIALLNVAGTPAVLDAFSYEGNSAAGTVNGLTGTFVVTEGTGHPTGDAANATSGMSRLPNGRDTDNNATDFALRPVTPGLAN